MKLLKNYIFISLFVCSFHLQGQNINQIIKNIKVELKKELPDSTRAKFFGDLTWYYQSISIDSSLKYGNLALNILENLTNKKMLAQQYNDMGAVFLTKGDLAKSKNFFFKTIKIREQLNDSLGIGKVKANLAALYIREQKLDSAMIFNLEALKIMENNGALKTATIIKSNIATLYIDLKNYDKAIKYLQEVLVVQKSLKDTFYEANSLSNLGNAHLYKQDTTKAILYFKEAISLAKSIKNDQTRAVSLANLGNIYSAQGKSILAISTLEEALEIRKKLNSKYDLTSIKLTIGLEYLRSKNIKKAKKHLKETIPYFTKNNIKDKLIQVYSSLTIISAYEGNKKMVNHYSDKFSILSNAYLSENITKEIAELETKYETEKKEKEIALQKEQLLESELKIKNRTLYAILITAVLLIVGILSFGFYKRSQLKRKQLQKEIDLKDALAIIKTQNKLQEQRLRISRDLHDNIGSQLTFIISSIDNLKFITKDASEKLKDKLSSISSFTSDTIFQLRDTIWAMNKSEITIEDLHARILSFIEKAKTATENTEFVLNNAINPTVKFTSLVGINLFRVVQEAINNSIKYSEATEIKITLSEKENQFIISIKDNGKGFDKSTVTYGNGLNNIEKRMTEIDGKMAILSNEKSGTKIKIVINK
jgi:signal transduction histidine kinase